MRWKPVQLFVCVVVGSILLSCGDVMTKDTQPTTGQGDHSAESLPHEPKSSAELLSATHLFTVETLDLSAGTWARGADELEHRGVSLKFRLLERFKGELKIGSGDSFEVQVGQRRENALTVSDFHGFWSHALPVKGARYLVMAEGAGNDPALLMQEASIKALVDAGLATDVKAAIVAEHQFGAALLPQADPVGRRVAALGLLKLAQEKRSAYGGLFGRYLWARIAPVYALNEGVLTSPTLEIVQAKDATRDLREALIYGLYDETLSLGTTPERTLGLLRPRVGLTLQPEAVPLLDRLLQVPIYNLVFQPGMAPVSPASVMPDAASRVAAAAVVARYKSERARRVAQWLAGEAPK